MNPKLVGNWFLVRNKNTEDLMVVRAKKVIPSRFSPGSFQAVEMESGWMCLNKDDRTFNGEFSDITRHDFNALNLPEVTYENSPVEIEIMPSGNVYFY